MASCYSTDEPSENGRHEGGDSKSRGSAANCGLSPEEILEVIRSTANRQLRRHTRGRGLGSLDEDDLRQELYARAYESLPSFDAGRSTLVAYLIAVLDNHLLNLRRHQSAAMRDHRRTMSLVSRSAQGDLVDWSGSIPQDIFDNRSPEERKHLELDLAAVEARLNDDDRWLTKMLRTHKLGEIAAQTGVSRSTLQYRVRRVLELFEDCGLKDFL